jgi:hypothetical protein
VLYGHRKLEPQEANFFNPTTYLTRQGAVTLTLTEKGATCSQWRP